MANYDLIVGLVKLAFAMIAAAAMIAFAVLPMLRMLRRTEEFENVLKPFEPPLEEELQIPADGEATPRKADRNQMISQLRADPHATAMLLRSAIREDKTRRQRGK